MNFLRSFQRGNQSRLILKLLNNLGLAIGIAVFAFILQYARYEWSYDEFHEDADHIYRVTYIRNQPGKAPYVSAASFPALGPAVAREFAEVESACRVVPVWGLKGLMVWEDRSVESEFINYADPNLFEFFSFKLLAGDPATALQDQHTAVLSSAKAYALFGEEDPIGQRIEMQTRDGRYFFEVTGVFDDNVATHITTDIFLSWTSLYAIPNVDRETIEQNWRWTQYPAYIKLNPQVKPEQLIAKFPQLIDKYLPDRPGKEWVSFGLQPLTSIHLHSHLYREIDQNGDAQVVNILLVIGVLVLLIGWINYINFYTASVADQIKNVGIRKTLGASRFHLLFYFIKESVAISLLAVLMAMGLIYLFQPYVIQQVGLKFPTVSLLSGSYLSTFLTLWLATALVCGIYPALISARIKPMSTMGMQGAQLGTGRLRKALVVFQFLASTVLIAGNFIIRDQLAFMANVDRGISKENVLAIDTYLYDLGGREHKRKIQLFKNILAGQQGVDGVAYASEVVGEGAAFTSSSHVLGRSAAETGEKIVNLQIIGPDYLELIDADLTAGRHFEYELDSQNLIINEMAAKLYGFQNPTDAIGQRIVFPGPGDTLQVIGVVENYLQQTAKEGLRPTVFRNNHWELSKVAVKVKADYLPDLLAFAKEEHTRIFPKSPFNYQMVDEILVENQQGEQKFASLFNLFGILIVFIALLGMLALSHFMAEKRQKEVCVRLVLGSSKSSIIRLVFSDFAKLVILGNLLAFPIIFFAADRWLNQFAYRVGFDWTVLAVTTVLTVLLVYLSSYFNLSRLARSNPAEVLRNE